jgi:uncharacterized protein YjbI with pentapeptide repeats
MMDYGRSASDVRQWPGSPAARLALEEYFAALSPNPRIVIPALNAGGLDFRGADLSGLELLGAEFINADLSGVRLVGARLGDAWLMGATLRNADLSHCSLRKAQGRGCEAQDVVAAEADLRSAEFEDANMSGADLHGSRLGRAWLPSVDLRNADLRGCVFGKGNAWTSLKEARMAGCRLDGAYGSVAGPVDVGLDSPRLIGGADLERWFAARGAPGVEIREVR